MFTRIVGLVIGILYGFGYGFLTLLVTGGGHGNFLWMMAFFLTFFYGLFFPVAGLLVANLEPLWARITLLVLLFMNLFATIYLFSWGLLEEHWEDAAETWERSPELFVFMSALHCSPLLVLWIIALYQIWNLDSEDATTIRNI